MWVWEYVYAHGAGEDVDDGICAYVRACGYGCGCLSACIWWREKWMWMCVLMYVYVHMVDVWVDVDVCVRGCGYTHVTHASICECDMMRSMI
jgi:hypothetical protein